MKEIEEVELERGQEEGGDCSLIRQFLLIDSDTGDLEDIETELVFLDSHASRSGTEDTEADCTLVIFRSVLNRRI